MKNIITESEKSRILKLHEAFGYKPILNEAITPESLKEKYVDTGRVEPETFDEILSVSGNKINYAAWLTKMVAEKLIEAEDVYKFDEYFEIFNNNKQHFPIKDINQIKTRPDLNEFMTMVIKMRERNVKIDDTEGDKSKNYLSPNDIQRLENVGINYLGMSDGYQVFEVPKSLKGNIEAYETYSEKLGRCAGRETGAKIDLCTIATFGHFNSHLKDGPLFVMFNLGDPKSPYQFHYESNQFKDKNNQDLF
jgi:hypothetical protein